MLSIRENMCVMAFLHKQTSKGKRCLCFEGKPDFPNKHLGTIIEETGKLDQESDDKMETAERLSK